MRKKDELTDPASCLNKARPDEMTFVLLGRDPAAPAAIRAWIDERVRLGKNRPDDGQVVEAGLCAATMERERADPHFGSAEDRDGIPGQAPWPNDDGPPPAELPAWALGRARQICHTIGERMRALGVCTTAHHDAGEALIAAALAEAARPGRESGEIPLTGGDR